MESKPVGQAEHFARLDATMLKVQQELAEQALAEARTAVARFLKRVGDKPNPRFANRLYVGRDCVSGMLSAGLDPVDFLAQLANGHIPDRSLIKVARYAQLIDQMSYDPAWAMAQLHAMSIEAITACVEEVRRTEDAERDDPVGYFGPHD